MAFPFLSWCFSLRFLLPSPPPSPPPPPSLNTYTQTNTWTKGERRVSGKKQQQRIHIISFLKSNKYKGICPPDWEKQPFAYLHWFFFFAWIYVGLSDCFTKSYPVVHVAVVVVIHPHVTSSSAAVSASSSSDHTTATFTPPSPAATFTSWCRNRKWRQGDTELNFEQQRVNTVRYCIKVNGE